jgi:hypothetical protein
MRHLNNIDTYRSKKQILEELQVAASQASEQGDISHLTLTFSVLLVKLSDEADTVTRNLIAVKRLLFVLIILLMIMVLPPIIQSVYAFVTENSFIRTGPTLPDFSGLSDWLRDLWQDIRDWILNLWRGIGRDQY